MNRRSFNVLSLAAAVAHVPGVPMAQHVAQDVTGYQVAEINDGQLSATSDGLARRNVPVENETLFQVASCSKTATAIAVLTLVRDGRVNLDTPVNRYLTRWQLPGPRHATATVAELMSHTAGTTVHGFAGYGPTDELPDILDILGGHAPANSGAIGTRHRLLGQFRYSGGGTMVLQAMIEDVSGENFATYVTRTVLQPVGASRATFAIRPASAFAHGFFEDARPVAGGFRRHPESAAAGLWATASDLAKLYQAVLDALNRSGPAIVPYELAQRMITPVRQQSGLGVFVEPGRAFWHEGRNYGFDAVVVAEPSTGRVRAAVANRNGALSNYTRTIIPR